MSRGMMVTCNFHAYKKEGYKAFLIPMDYMEQNRNPQTLAITL